jgi:spore maturation protein CgeB
VKILCAFGTYNYGDRNRGYGYEYSNFPPALKALGHELVFFDTLERERYRNFADLNRHFLETVEREKPHVILCALMLYELWVESLEIARHFHGCTVIIWGTDDSWQYRQYSRLVAPYCDIYATTDAAAMEKSRRDGFDNFFLTQWASSGATLQEPLPARDCRYAVSFVGSSHGDRAAWINELKRRGIDAACFGHGWKNGSVPAEDIPRIMRDSVISLNFSNSAWVRHGLSISRSRQIKARIFEVPGCGGFLLTQPADDLDRYYVPGREIVIFDDPDGLAEKIKYYLAHPEERDRIARAGHERTRSEHTYEIRFARLLEAAGALSQGHASRSAPGWDITGNPPDFSELVDRHQSNTGLRMLRVLMIVPCVLLWGRKRGPRAARRILFELSWRIFGRKTYSASGWPGRIFYRES